MKLKQDNMSSTHRVPSPVLPYSILPSLAQTTLVILFANVILLSSALNRNIGIAFTNLPESRIASPGDRVFFNCETSIGKDEQIRWLHNGAELGQREDVKITQNQLAIKVKNHRQTGRYLCVAGMGNTYIMSEPARLHIAHLDKFRARSTSPDVEANVGNDVMLACNPPESQPPAIIQWFKDDRLLNYTDNVQLVNLKHLLLIDVNRTDAGLFTCHASNHLTREVTKHPEPLNLTILPPEEHHKPRLLFEPETEYHPVIGEDLTIPCSASGSPKPTIFWTPKPASTSRDGLLTIDNASHNDTGEYICHIFNGRGRKILRRTIVTVFEKPKCTIYSNGSEPFNEGDSLELFCEAVGIPLPQIHWVVNGNRKHRDNPLFIDKLAISDAGIYQCFAENKVGTSSDAVILPIIPKTQNSTLPQLHEDYFHYDNSSYDYSDDYDYIDFEEIGSSGVTVNYSMCDDGDFYTDDSSDDPCLHSILPASVVTTFGPNVKLCCGFHGFFVQGDCFGSDEDGKEFLVEGIDLCYNIVEERDFDDVHDLPHVTPVVHPRRTTGLTPHIPKKALDCPARCSVKTIWMFPDDPNITKSDSEKPVLNEDGDEYEEFCMAYSCIRAGWQVSADVCNCPDEPEQPVERRDSDKTIETEQDEGIEEPERSTSRKIDSDHTNKEMFKTGRNKANQPNIFGGFYGLIFYYCTFYNTLYILNLVE